MATSVLEDLERRLLDLPIALFKFLSSSAGLLKLPCRRLASSGKLTIIVYVIDCGEKLLVSMDDTV